MIASLVVLVLTVLFLWFLWKKVRPRLRGHTYGQQKLIRSQSRSGARRR